jgi:hypothetical protein
MNSTGITVIGFSEPATFQITEELHKLFQYIDQTGRGFLEVSEILNF